MGNFGAPEMLVIAVFALLVFGPEKLPDIARQVGKAVREFKKISGDFNRELQMGLEEQASPKKDDSPKEEAKELKPGPR